MNVLVACEFSGVVRDAFTKRGHYAVSVDLIPSETPGKHIQRDILDYLDEFAREFDLMVAFPPCTYLANSGVRWLYGGKGTVRDMDRWEKMTDAAIFFKKLLQAPIPRIAVENPIMHKYAAEIVGQKYSQIIQPYEFGHGETKKTALWLKNLPKLQPTDIVDEKKPRVHFESPSPDRWKNRSRTYQGIADAMADQWGIL